MASLNSVERNKHTRARSKRGYAALQTLLRHQPIGFLLGHKLPLSFGFDGSRSNAVYAHVVLSDFSGQCTGEADDCSLRSDVVGQVL